MTELGGHVVVALLGADVEAETLQLGDVLVLHGLLHHQAPQEDHVTIIIVSKGNIFIIVVMTMTKYCMHCLLRHKGHLWLLDQGGVWGGCLLGSDELHQYFFDVFRHLLSKGHLSVGGSPLCSNELN